MGRPGSYNGGGEILNYCMCKLASHIQCCLDGWRAKQCVGLMESWAHNKNFRLLMGEVKRNLNMGKISASQPEVVIFADDSLIKRGLVTVRLEVSIIGKIVNRGFHA